MSPWMDYEENIAGVPCITLKGSTEKCISGPRGELWPTNQDETEFKAFIVHNGAILENVFTFNIKDLKKWIKRIGAPFRAVEQLPYANNPNARFKG